MSVEKPDTRDPATPCTVIPSDQLSPADPTPGMTRHVAANEAGMWTGVVDTEPGAVSNR